MSVKVTLHGEVTELSVLLVEAVQALSYWTYTSCEFGAERMSPSPRPIQIVP